METRRIGGDPNDNGTVLCKRRELLGRLREQLAALEQECSKLRSWISEVETGEPDDGLVVADDGATVLRREGPPRGPFARPPQNDGGPQ